MEVLRYSTWGIVRQCLTVIFTAFVIGGLLFLPSHDLPAPYHRIGPVCTSVALMLIGYGGIVQAIRTWLLLADDKVALGITSQGINLHSVWVRRSFAWSELRSVALERRSTRNGHYFVVVIQSLSGWMKRFSVRTRQLDGTLDAIGAWADNAEAKLIVHGGTPISQPTGWLSKRLWQWDQARIAKARLKSIRNLS